MPHTLFHKKVDEFQAPEQGNLFVSAYEAKFHALSRYASQLLGTEN